MVAPAKVAFRIASSFPSHCLKSCAIGQQTRNGLDQFLADEHFLDSLISQSCSLKCSWVSGSGCRIEVGEPFTKGEAVRITLYGLEGSTDPTLAGEVRWHRATDEGNHVIGAKFTGTAAVLAGRLLGTVPGQLL